MNLTDTSGFLTALGRVSAQAGVLVLLVLLVQRVFRKQLTPRWRCALWLLVMARLLLPVSFGSVVSVFNLAPRWAAPGPGPVVAHSTPMPANPQPPPPPDFTLLPVTADSPPPIDERFRPDGLDRAAAPQPELTAGLLKPVSAPPYRISWPRAFLLIWLTGVSVLSVYVVFGSIRVSRRLAGLRPLTDPEVLAVLNDCRQQLGLRGELVVVESAAVGTPALYGFLRPRLVLPQGFTGAFSRGELRFVLLHELAHVKRRDILVNWLVAFLQVVHWFNPLVWLGFARWRADRELACDALALEAAGPEQNREYGKTILRLLEGFTHRVAAPGLVGILEDKNQLRRRIAMIAAYVPARRWSIPAAILTIALAATGLTDAQNKPAVADKPKDQTPAVQAETPPAAPRGSQSRAQVINGPAMKVTVLDAATGRPLPGAEVFAPNFASFDFGQSEIAPHWTADAQGVAVIRLGEPSPIQSRWMTWFAISARHKGYSPRGYSWSAEQKDIRSTMPGEITVRLERGITIGGVVRDDVGTPVAGVQVRVFARGYSYELGNQLHQEYLEFWTDPGASVAVTDSSGRWQVPDFPRDLERVAIELIRRDGTEARFKHGTDSDNPNTNLRGDPISLADLRDRKALFTLKPSLVLRGTVLDPNGKPMPPGVLIKTRFGLGNRDRGPELQTDVNGRFALTHSGDRQIVLTAYPDQFAIASVTAGFTHLFLSNGNSTAKVFFSPVEFESEVRLKLSPQRPLHIRVTDGDDRPLAGAEVEVDNTWPEGQVLDFKGVTDGKGDLIWSNAPPSHYALVATSPGLRIRQKIRITPEQREATFRLRAGMDKEIIVKGVARDARTGAEIPILASYQTSAREGFRTDDKSTRTAAPSRLTDDVRQVIHLAETNENVGMNHWTVDGEDKLKQQWFWYRLGTNYNSGFELRIPEKGFRPGIYPSYQLELKAAGYETLTTPWHNFDEGDWSSVFDLQPIERAIRTVLRPNGEPASGARVWARRNDSDGILFCNDPNRYYGDRMGQSGADARGQFVLPEGSSDLPVIFTHSDGFLELTGVQAKQLTSVQLQPWGRVEGVLKVAGQPKRGAPVMLASEWDPSCGHNFLYLAVTGPDGSFVFENVPAGEFRLSRRVTTRNGPITEDHQQPITVKAGERLKVEYGGFGRAVIGQAMPNQPDLMVDWLNDDHVLRLKQTPIPSLNLQDFATAEAFREANNASFKSPERVKQRREARTYVFKFERDGSFRADDVPPGTYELRIRVTKPPDGNQSYAPGSGDELGSLVREIVVPDGKEAFDLGTLIVPIKSQGTSITKSPLPELTVQTFEGQPLGLSDFRGKNLLLVFWAAWSDRSAEQLADLQKIHAEFAKDQRLAMLSVNVDDDLDAARKTVNARHYQWPQAWASPENRAKNGASFEVNALPTVLLLDPQGRIVGRDLQGDRLQAAVKRALAKN